MSDRPPPEVVLVRHGETEWTVSRRHTGNTDIPLTDVGRQEAAQLGERLRLSGERFARVLSSPLSRALDTCRLAGLGDRVEVRDELREWDYGDYEGRTSADIRTSAPGWLLWRDGVPNGETIDEVATRVDLLIADIRSTPPTPSPTPDADLDPDAGSRPGPRPGSGPGPDPDTGVGTSPGPSAGPGRAVVVVFAHGHLLRLFAARWLAQPPAFGAHLSLGPASLCRLGWEHGVPSIALWNDRSHLSRPVGVR